MYEALIEVMLIVNAEMQLRCAGSASRRAHVGRVRHKSDTSHV